MAADRLFDRLLRFTAAGAVNTLASYAVYLMLLQVLPYRISYSIAYVFGIGLAYVLYRRFVFRTRGGRFAPLFVLLAYLVQYLVGLGTVTVWVAGLGGPAFAAPLVAAAISLPLTFAINQFGFQPRAGSA